MSIKGLKPVIGGRYHQGIYSPKNPQKYIGFTAAPTYRSLLELEVFQILDDNDIVIRWTSESDQTIIKFKNPFYGKRSGYRTNLKIISYHPDIYAELKNGNTIKKYLMEIKPLSKLKRPSVNDSERIKIEYIIVKSKEAAAIEWCKPRNMEYIFVTEKTIHNLKKKF
jgi:hypothetical protein